MEKHIITQEALNDFVRRMEDDGFVMGETFGLILGTDAPAGMSAMTSSSTLSRFWYKADIGNGQIETFSPWLAAYLENPTKLTVDIEVGVKDDYYEEPTASQSEFKPNYDQFGPGNHANNLPPRDTSNRENNIPAGTTKVEHGYVFEVPLSNLVKRKVKELKECYIVLYEHFVIYKIIGKYEALDDETEMWKDYKTNYRWTRMRKDITDVNMYYDNYEHLYAVQIEFSGKNETTWFYEKGADAKKLYDVLQNYFVTRDQKLDDYGQTKNVPQQGA